MFEVNFVFAFSISAADSGRNRRYDDLRRLVSGNYCGGQMHSAGQGGPVWLKMFTVRDGCALHFDCYMPVPLYSNQSKSARAPAACPFLVRWQHIVPGNGENNEPAGTRPDSHCGFR
jgi:hypothetical protein